MGRLCVHCPAPFYEAARVKWHVVMICSCFRGPNPQCDEIRDRHGCKTLLHAGRNFPMERFGSSGQPSSRGVE